MKKQTSKTSKSTDLTVEPTEVSAIATESAETEVKPKARKKKAAAEAVPAEIGPAEIEPAEVGPVKPEAARPEAGGLQIVEAAPEPVAPARKAAKKPAKKGSGKNGKNAPVGANPEFKQAIAAQLDAPKKLRKAKGRDLVAEEPGLEEIADVLGTTAEEKQEGADEIAGESKPVDGLVAESDAPEGKPERLQKILAKAGISSRRKAEELILEGRVQINGQIVKELGTKADMARDHVRVDGKLLQGAERIRYFVLNKPKGFVTTVSDPEGRPTVMEFFSNERERLYPVGRLDYLSEGLLLVTNDGELANKLTKAASGVEKTYLVKVAGQPTEDMLDVLRQGVVIERGRPGTNSGRVRTAPAKIRQVRQGDNPWYEVIVIEGRNRELRKMFEEIGHHVEKIRRIGYGPLVLDQEPGKMRELEPEEVQALRLTADGKLKPKRRKGPAEAQLPTVAGKTVRYKKADGKPGFEPRRVRPEFQQESKSDAPSSVRIASRDAVRPSTRRAAEPGSAGRSARPGTGAGPGVRQPLQRPAFQAEKPEFQSDRKAAPRGDFKAGSRPPFSAGRPGGRPDSRTDSRGGGGVDGRESFRRGASGDRANARPAGRSAFPAKNRRPEPPVTDYVLPPRKAQPEGFDEAPKNEFNPDYKPGFRSGDKPGSEKRGFDKPGFRGAGGKPAFRKDSPPKRFGGGRPGGERFDETGASTAPPFNSSERGDKFDRPKFARPGGEREAYPDAAPEKRVKLSIEPVAERAREPRTERPRDGGFGGGAKPFRPAGGRPNSARPGGDRPGFASRPPAGDRPYRAQRDRLQGDRPQGEQGEGQSFRPGSERRPEGTPRGEFRPRQAGPRASGERSGPSGATRPFNARPGSGRPGSGRPAFGGPSAGRPGTGRTDGPAPRRPGGFESGRSERSREPGSREPRPGAFKPREAGPREFKMGAAKKFGAKPGFGAKSRAGADGPPRGDAPVKKERWRNSFTGKNKGRPKPKGKKDE